MNLEDCYIIEEVKKRRCPKCGHTAKKHGADWLQYMDENGEPLAGTGVLCPICIINDMRERYPQMEEIEDDDQT